MKENINRVWYYYKQVIQYILKRLEYVSEVSKDIAQVFFAAFAIETLAKSPVNWSLVERGLLVSVIFWTIGIISYRLIKK
jgi:hypothetical protein